MASLSLRHVSKIYSGGHAALADLTLDVGGGEFFAFCGPSGSGKSTILRMIAGLEEPSGGEIFIDGVPIMGKSARERDVIYIRADMPFPLPKGTVYDNIAYPLKVRGYEAEEMKRRTLRAARVAKVEELLEKRVSEISDKQRILTALARIAVRSAKVVLLDDIFNKVSGEDRAEIMQVVSSLSSGSDSVFICTSTLCVEAMTLASRIAVMKNGIIRGMESPKNLYENPGDAFVATFFGNPPMSLIPSVLKKSGEDFSVQVGDTSIKLPQSLTRKLTELPVSGEVFVGVRAEDFHTEQMFIEASSDTVISGTVRLVERYGGESLLHMNLGGKEGVIVKADARLEVERGDTVRVAIDSNKIHLFDKVSGRNLAAMPQYNRIGGDLVAHKDGRLSVDFGKNKLFLVGSVTDRLIDRQVIGSGVLLALAPEALTLLPKGGETEDCFEGEVDFTVNYHGYMAAYLRVGGLGERLVAKVSTGCDVSSGESVIIKADMKAALLMRENGVRLIAKCPITDNATGALIEHKGGKSTVVFGKTKLKAEGIDKWKSGQYPHFRIPPLAVNLADKKPDIKALVQETDYNGEYTLLYLQVDGFKPYFTAAIEGKHDFPIGSKVGLSVDFSAVQPVGTDSLFDYIVEQSKTAPVYVHVE